MYFKYEILFLLNRNKTSNYGAVALNLNAFKIKY